MTKPLSKPQLEAAMGSILDEGPTSEHKLKALLEREFEAQAIRRRECVSAPGAIARLHPLLEERRLQYNIPDAAFTVQAAFDAVFIHQVDDNEQETFVHEGKILRPGKKLTRDQITSPRGIVVSAGARALEVLLSNGMDLGHMVTTLQMAPFKREFPDPVDYSLLMMRVGDVFGSEDTAANIRAGRVTMAMATDRDGQEHVVFRRGNDEASPIPQLPWISADH